MPEESRRSDRKNTDESLRVERSKTDDELSGPAARAADDADDVVTYARRRADVVLERARARAEATADPDDLEGRAVRVAARAEEDAVLASERSTADSQLALERTKRSGDVSRLLADERAVTDARLSTERRSADASVDARDEVLGLVGHELRNLAMAATLSTTVLRRVPIADERARAAVDEEAARIRECMDLMLRVIDDLVDVAAIDAGRLRLDPAPDAPLGVLRRTAQLFAAAARLKGIRLDVAVDGEEPTEAVYDRGRILQVLANLVGNAVKFTARAIVEAHGGRIWVDSRPGAGSSFGFELARVTARPYG